VKGKLLQLILSILMLITSIPLYPSEVEASNSSSTKPYDTGAWFEDGNFVFVAANKKATSTIRYGGKAFILRFDNPNDPSDDHLAKICNGLEPLLSDCHPLKGGSDHYLRINLYDNNGNPNKKTHGGDWNWDDIDECDYVNQFATLRSGLKGRPVEEIADLGRCEQEGLTSGEPVVVSRYEIDKVKMTDILRGHEKFKNLGSEMTVYINTIFRVINDPKYSEFKHEFTTLNEIRSAEWWANPSYFRSYYDVPIPFYGYYPVTLESVHQTTGGNLLDPVSIPNEAREDTNWPAWKGTNGAVQIEKTIIGSEDGKGYSLVCSYIIPTKDPPEDKPLDCSKATDNPYWIRLADTTTRDPWVDIGGSTVVAVYNTVDCDCSHVVSIPDKSSIEGEVPAENTLIGQQVPMQINVQQAEDSLEDWKEWVKDKSNFRIKVRLWRSDQTDVLTGLANTGDAALWSPAGNSPIPATDLAPDLMHIVSSDELLNLLDGGSESKLIYNDDLTNYPIPEGGKVSFRYNASVEIWARDDITGEDIRKLCASDSESIEMTWFRPMPPDVDQGNFISVPKYYSEIKQGAPQTSGTGANEQFDAMSGTPTTRNLYFASGGSEFIVDVQVEYVPQVTQTRNYTSEFKAVTNGWAMSPITGGKGHDSVPSKPTAREKTDACGASYTETVSQKSTKHVIQPYIPCSGDPCTGGQPEISHTDYWWVQEGYDDHEVGGYVDTWTQTVTFDYMKINKAVVWKIDRSKVNGMATLVGTDEVTATITQGNPTIFANVASANTSAEGRLRYSLETDQHDSVYWDEGDSDNCLTNTKDGPVKEQKQFDTRRELETNVTAISDFLILQTSSGDQSVLYFDEVSNTATTTEQLDVPTHDFDTMWTNNALSAANWDPVDTIRVGSYNGSFSSPTHKYSGNRTSTVSTIFDSKPAGLHRTARPSPYLRLMETGLDIPDALPNGEYRTGVSDIFYSTIWTYNPTNLPVAYSTAYDSKYNANGQSFTTAYSDYHNKVNDVVIHNPVSVQDALVISLPDRLDQRTPASRAIGGNLQEGIPEFERVLDPDYRQNLIPNPNAEIVNADESVAGWHTWVKEGDAANITFTSRSDEYWVIEGASTFEVNAVVNSGTEGGYWKDIPVKPNTSYQFEGDISCHRCIGYFSLQFYTADKTATGSAIGASDVNPGWGVQHKSFTMESPADAAYLRIHMVKGENISSAFPRDHLFVDNLSLKNRDEQEFVAIEPVFVTREIPNPDYVPPQNQPPVEHTFTFTGDVQEFVAPSDGVYTLEVWGAQGGSTGYDVDKGGLGGYAKGNITLTKGQTLYVYVGESPYDSSYVVNGGSGSFHDGGWNGGGRGSGAFGGGGGATDIRIGGTTLHDRKIVAGGGGGGGENSHVGASGGGETGGTAESWAGTPGGGGTQSSGGSSDGGTANGSFGTGGDAPGYHSADEGGGGGGWYGGGAGAGEAVTGGGGSGYIGGVDNGVTTSGVQSGHGKAVISSPGGVIPAVGQPTKIIMSLAGGSDDSPPSEAYILQPVTVDPNQGAGGYSPGNFILLDYGFQLYFPNTGDFYGNGQWGWSETTSIRGKGYTDDMDTTEWTKEKYVKFGFNVIYNDQMYIADEWIPLNVSQSLFDFYVPLANREKISALVEWKSIAINARVEDGDVPANKVRYDAPRVYGAKHSTIKKYNVDVVGRIGNMVIEDTKDFRFSNFFKQPLVPTQWFIPNVVPRVDLTKQHKIIGDQTDIRGETVSAATQYLNTYGLLTHLQQQPVAFPLSPEKNTIPALKNQPLRLGYHVLADIQTIGNYYSRMEIIPYYYHVNLRNGDIAPVDIYMNVQGEYKPINKHGLVQPGWDPTEIYANPVRLQWGEAQRRNVFSTERNLTSSVAGVFAQAGGDTSSGKAAEPYGSYLYGDSQFLALTGRNRTYMGQDTTYGVNRNPGTRLSMLEYAMQAQRWHYSYVLPSSAVAVLKGQQPSQANIDALRTNTSVIVMAADIKAVGDTYTLQYTAPNNNGNLNIAGTSWPLDDIPHPVVTVFSASKTSADDLDVRGTH